MSTKTWPFDSVMPIIIRGSDGIARKAFVMTALTTKQRSSGMMGLKDWNNSDGMLFIHPRGESEGYWMKDTVLPMTISFFNQDGKFMYQKDAKPLDTTHIKPDGVFFYVLETPIKSTEYFKIGPCCSLIKGMQKTASLEHTLITGVPGSGKTTKAYELSKDTGMPVIQLDKVFAKTPEWKFDEDAAKRIRDLIAKLDTPTIIEGTQLMTLSGKDLEGHKVIILEAMKLELLKRLLKRGWYDNDGKLWRNPIESNKMLNEFKPMVEEFRERANLSKQSSVIDDATNLLSSLRGSVVRRLGGVSPRIDPGGLISGRGPVSVGARFPAFGHEGDVSLGYRPHDGSYNVGLGYSGDNWDLGGEFGNDHGPHWGVHGEIRW